MKQKALFVVIALLACLQGISAQSERSWLEVAFRDQAWCTDYYTANEWHISTPEQLAQFCHLLNSENPKYTFEGKKVYLDDDIDISGKLWWCNGFLQNYEFMGLFDGQGHTIKGMTLNATSAGEMGYQGFFKIVGSEGVVQNVTFTAVSISAYSGNNGVITGVNRGKIINCRVGDINTENDVLLTMNNRASYSGGITGVNNGEIRGCVVANLNLPVMSQQGDYFGGICGNNTSTIKDCLALNVNIGMGQYSGAIVGFRNTNTSQMSNNYYVGGNRIGLGVYADPAGEIAKAVVLTLKDGTIVDGEATEYGDDLKAYNPGLVLGESLYFENGKEVTFAYGGELAPGQSVEDFKDGDDNTLASPYTVTTPIEVYPIITEWIDNYAGTQEAPYVIHNVEEMNLFASYVNAGDERIKNKYVRLVNDLEYQSTDTYTAVGTIDNPFYGVFDGEGHTISGINLNTIASNQGIFGKIDKSDEMTSVVKNLSITESVFETGRSLGGIVGFNRYGIVENCHVSESVLLKACAATENISVGGVVGDNYGVVKGCTSAAQFDNTFARKTQYGGIVGWTNFDGSSITDCLFYGDITVAEGDTYIGAIVGRLGTSTVVENCFYTCKNIKSIGDDTGQHSSDQNLKVQRVWPLDEDPGTLGEKTVEYGFGDNVDVTFYEKGVGFGGKYYAAIVVLTLDNDADNSEIIAQYDGMRANVTIKGRTLYRDGNWNSICLPFATGDEGVFAGAKFYKFEKAEYNQETKTATFKYSDETYLSAAANAFVKWEESLDNVEDPVFENVYITNRTPDSRNFGPNGYSWELTDDCIVSCHGTFAPLTLEKDDRTKLFLGGDKLYYPSEDVPVGAFRCYLELLNGLKAGDLDTQDAQGVKTFVLDFGNGETTAIDLASLNAETSQERTAGKGEWYTIDGRRLTGTPAQKGIYVKDGRKLVVK